MNEDFLNKMGKIKNNLESAKNELKYLRENLSNSIDINSTVFRDRDISLIEDKLSILITNLNKTIIPKIKSM